MATFYGNVMHSRKGDSGSLRISEKKPKGKGHSDHLNAPFISLKTPFPRLLDQVHVTNQIMFLTKNILALDLPDISVDLADF